MSREILFRAWDKNGKGWVNGFNMYGFSVGQGCPYRMLKRFSTEWKENDFELEQFTGLTDKNGTKIFEGDIVQGCDSKLLRAEIIYNAPAFELKWINSYVPNIRQKGLSEPMFQNTSIIHEVIGNIHDNPELLLGGDGE